MSIFAFNVYVLKIEPLPNTFIDIELRDIIIGQASLQRL